MLKYERVPEEIRNLSSSQFQEIADHFHETLKPLFWREDTPEIDYSRQDHRRAYLLYYVAPYAAQLGYWISHFGLETALKEFTGEIVLIGTGPSPEMIAIEYFCRKRGWDSFSYHCIDLNGAWEEQVDYLFRGDEHLYEYHTADVSEPTCWTNLPINFSEVDLIVCQNFLNEIPRTMAKTFEKSFATLFDSLSEGSSLLFSDLWGYNSTYPLNSLEKFWNENAFIEEAGVDGQVKLQVDIPPQSFPRLLGPLQDSDGRRMDSFWRKKNLRTFAKRVVKTNGTPAVENYENYRDFWELL